MDSKNQNSIGLRTLIAKAQAGDEAAFTSLVQRFREMALHTCYGYLGDWQLAEDAAQDAWIAAFRELPSLREPAAFVAWFRTVLFKQCDRLTRRKAARILPLATAETLPDAALPHDERVATDEQCALIEVALALLPERERAVVERFYVAEQDQQTIGASLGMPVQTVKNRLFAARRQLRATLSALDAPAVHTDREERRDRGLTLLRHYEANEVRCLALLRQAVRDLHVAFEAGDRRPETVWALNRALYADGQLATSVRVLGEYAAVTPDPDEAFAAREQLCSISAQLGGSKQALAAHQALLADAWHRFPPERLLKGLAMPHLVQAWRHAGATSALLAVGNALVRRASDTSASFDARMAYERSLADSVFLPLGDVRRAAKHSGQLRAMATEVRASVPAALPMLMNALGTQLLLSQRQGKLAEADAALADGMAVLGADNTSVRPQSLRWALHDFGCWCLWAGFYSSAQALFEQAQAVSYLPETDYFLAAALLHATADRAASLAHLRRALQHPRLSTCFGLSNTLRADPLWAPVRYDPAFRAVVRQATNASSDIA